MSIMLYQKFIESFGERHLKIKVKYSFIENNLEEIIKKFFHFSKFLKVSVK